MKKNIKIMFCFALVLTMSLFIPSFSVKAANTYSVEMVSNSSNNRVIGTYSSYSAAVSAMNSQSSNSQSVASIYKNGKIINSRYAIFRFNASNSTVNLFQNASDSTAYTYTNPSSMTDAAFIDCNESRAQIMLNGFKGWIDLNVGNIIPVSLLGANAVNVTASGLNLRSDHSTSSASLASITCTNTLFTYTETYKEGSYTWYKISYNGKTGWIRSGEWLTETTGQNLNTYYYRYSTGNLLHRYAYHNGTSYDDYFTNLGPTPSYLSEGVHYYSFDGGIYFYTTLTSMLDDYRNNDYAHSLNYNKPNYPYYLYLPNKSTTKLTAAQLDANITNTSSKMYGQGVYFKEAESLYGVNALLTFALAKNESASGTSSLARNKNNIFGYGAVDSDPYNQAYGYSSVRDSIMDYATHTYSYMNAGRVYYFGTHAGTKVSGRNVKYASDPLWGEKLANNAFMVDKGAGLIDYNTTTIAVSKFNKYNLPVYRNANDSEVIYYMRNQNTSLKVYNVSVTVLEKVGDYYKINADSDTYNFGYVKASDFNINNNAPVINATDRTVNLNSTFNYMEGVTATDAENGNLTNKVTYDQTVNTSKAGEYSVTYRVTDNSNLTTSKTIKVTVKGDSIPVITASDKEVSQYTSFDIMDGVTATDDIDGDLTSSITTEGSVNTDEVGEYEITYNVVNSKGKSISKTITVTVIENEKPAINVSDKTVSLNKEFNPLKGVTATDKEDGDLTSSITVTSNNVNTSLEGEYSVNYSVSDSANQETVKTIKVTVCEKTLEKANGLFYLDYLKKVDGNLQIKGYNTITGIDNTLDNDISYKIKFVNIDTLDESYQEALRITDTKEMPKSIYSFDGKDYTYSWFKLNIDLSSLEFGNYKMYVISESDDYYSENIINNKLNKTIDSNFVLDDKTLMIRRNYSYEGSPVELIVRDGNYVKKTSGTYYNQFDKYTKFEFNSDNKLYLRGVSYSYGMDLASSKIVSRQIIFENMDTYETYSKNLGSITNGNYNVVLPESDKLDKTRAWYDATIDLADIPKGNYVIYITTTANVTDIYEMTEKMGRSLDNVIASIDEKDYSFSINKNRGNRIEMIVK